MWLLIPVVIVLCGIIFFLLGRGQKVVYIDPSAEQIAKAEKEYHEKREALLATIAEERKISIEEIRKDEELLQNSLREKEKVLNKELLDKQNQQIENFNRELELKKEQIESRKEKLNELLKEEEVATTEKVEQFKTLLNDWQSRQHAAVEASKREDEIKQKDNFYKIVLNEDEIEELNELNKAIKKLRNPMPFRKAVYDIYYKPKTNDLVKRVVGMGRVTGIYKITHIESQKVYVGQSVDIGNRWKQHAKRGCAADVITNNKLYPAMLEEGIESFTWEIIEEVDSDKLSEAEKYWQEYYKAKDFGYSMK